MFDPKKLLDELLGSNVPGTTGTVRDQAGKAVQMAAYAAQAVTRFFRGRDR